MNVKLYLITDEYINYLHKRNSSVMLNKNYTERTYHRKYLGIVQEFNNHKYFVPLSSPKKKDFDSKTGKIKKDNLATIYIRNKERLYGTLRFNNMIPVPEHELISYELNDEGDMKYKMLVLNELIFMRKNQDKIERTAKNLYEAKTSLNPIPESKKTILYITLNFNELEKYCDEFVK